MTAAKICFGKEFVVAVVAGNEDTCRPQGEDVEPDRVRDVPPEEQDHRTDVQDKTGEKKEDKDILLEISACNVFNQLLSDQEVKCRMREESSRPLTTSAPQSLTEDQETEVSL